MPWQDLRIILIILATIVVIRILVALIGYPMLILVALLATFAVFAVMILMSVEDVGLLARRMGCRSAGVGRTAGDWTCPSRTLQASSP